MESNNSPNETMPLNRAARRLRVPAGWLREEVSADRIPALRAGRAILIHIPTVARVLTERAAQGGKAVANAR